MVVFLLGYTFAARPEKVNAERKVPPTFGEFME